MIKVAVFDFDGTLVDSNAIKRQTFDEVVADLPGGPEALSMARQTGGDRYRIFGDVARRIEGGPSLARSLASEYTRRCLCRISLAPERRGARLALRSLSRRGVKIWVNSATPGRDLPALLKGRGLLRLASGSLGTPRSKSQNLREILRRERARPWEAVVIGDGRDDQAAAKNVGTWFVAVTAEAPPRCQTAFALPDLMRLPYVVLRLGLARRRS